jgi:hypothetical protein
MTNFDIMSSKLYIYIVWKKGVPIQLYKVCWNNCSVERRRVYILFNDSFKRYLIHVVINWACPKAQRVKLVSLCCRPLNIVFKMNKYYPKTSNRYWIADHYTNGHAPQKTTILKWIRNHVNLNVGQKVTGQKFMDEKSQFVIWRKKIFDFFKVKFQLYFKTCIRNIALQSQGRTRRAPPLKLE